MTTNQTTEDAAPGARPQPAWAAKMARGWSRVAGTKDGSEEAEAIDGRIAQVDRTVALRETAKDAIFSRKGSDPVVDVLKRERVELALSRQVHRRHTANTGA